MCWEEIRKGVEDNAKSIFLSIQLKCEEFIVQKVNRLNLITMKFNLALDSEEYYNSCYLERHQD